MFFDISKLFPNGKKPNVTIRTERAMQLEVGGENRHVDEGEEIEVSYEIFRQLSPDDYKLLSSGLSKVEVPDPTPARPEPSPLPNGWDKLPKCFADSHAMKEEIRCARQHLGLIRQARINIFGSNVDLDETEGTVLIGNIAGGIDSRTNYTSSLKPFDLSDPVTKKLSRYLSASIAKAEDYLERVLIKTDIPLQRAFYACGNHRLDVAEELKTIVSELAEIGFALFEIRLQALGLAEGHVRRLYSGSADFQTYGCHQPPYDGGVCFAGLGDDGVTMRRYSDLPVAESASFSISDAARIIELKPLLVEAKKQLARAQKAQMVA